MVVFDKTGRLAGLQSRADAAEPRRYDPADLMLDRFMLYHANDKVERALENDPASVAACRSTRTSATARCAARVSLRFEPALPNRLPLWTSSSPTSSS